MTLRLFAFLISLLAFVATASAQVTFNVSGSLRHPNPGQLYVVTVEVNGFPADVPHDIGIRIDTPGVLDTFSVACYDSDFVSSSPSEVVYRRNVTGARGPVVLKIGLRSKTDFRGTYRLTPFVRRTGETTDLASTVRVISVGTLPSPDVLSPRHGKVHSPAPSTICILNNAYVVSVQHEIEYQTAGGLITIITDLHNSGLVDRRHFTATNGLREGPASCRIRAIDAAGYPGEWTEPILFTVSGAITGYGSSPQATFENFRSKGWTNLIQMSWFGRLDYPNASQAVINAHNAGMKIAAKAELNFDNSSFLPDAPADQTGVWQMEKCLASIGFTGDKSSLVFDLKLVVIQVERYMGTMAPADRVQRIAEAVQHIRNSGFWPAIHTRNDGINQWWDIYTGNSTDFADLPLWDSFPVDEFTDFRDHLDMNALTPWIPYGGWTSRTGKRYLDNRTIFGKTVDLSVCEPAIWEAMSPDPGMPNMVASAVVRRQPGGGFWLDISVMNKGTCEAYAVRVDDVTLNGAPSLGRESLRKIDAGGQKTFTRSYGPEAGQLGQTVPVTFTVWTGMGPQSFNVNVTL